MRNVRLDLCYDGSRYKGWQRLSGCDNTIQGKLENTLSRILGESIELIGSGRTDAGTHALCQVANFHCDSQMPCAEILAQLRQFLPEDIGVYSCKNVSERFHARLNAKTKTYRYRVWNSEMPCVLERRFVYRYERQLDLSKMRSAAEKLLGTHDFSAFCSNQNMKKSTIRHIHNIEMILDGNEIQFFFTGNGFLHNMVRIMVGTLLEIGAGDREPESIDALFGMARSDAGVKVPSNGLCLMEVTY